MVRPWWMLHSQGQDCDTVIRPWWMLRSQGQGYVTVAGTWWMLSSEGPTDNIWNKRQTVAGPWWMLSSRGPTVNWIKKKPSGVKNLLDQVFYLNFHQKKFYMIVLVKFLKKIINKNLNG